MTELWEDWSDSGAGLRSRWSLIRDMSYLWAIAVGSIAWICKNPDTLSSPGIATAIHPVRSDSSKDLWRIQEPQWEGPPGFLTALVQTCMTVLTHVGQNVPFSVTSLIRWLHHSLLSLAFKDQSLTHSRFLVTIYWKKNGSQKIRNAIVIVSFNHGERHELWLSSYSITGTVLVPELQCWVQWGPWPPGAHSRDRDMNE